MDIKFKDENKERSMNTKQEVVFGLVALVVLIGFAPGILFASLVLTIANKGFAFDDSNETLNAIGPQLMILITLVATVVLLWYLKRKYSIWATTLKRYLKLSAICLGLFIVYLLIGSMFESVAKKKNTKAKDEQLDKEYQRIVNENKKDTYNDSLNKADWELFKKENGIKDDTIITDNVGRMIHEDILKEKHNYKDKH